MQVVKVFAARSCATAILTSAALLAVIGFLAVLSIRSGPRGPERLVTLGLPLMICAVIAFFAAIVPSMRYTVTESEVIPSCGPFRWKIPIHQIRSIVEKDLEWLPWSEGWKIPGYALFKIRYGQLDAVRMCATALTKRILVIDTGTELWGITPADVKGFVAAVESRQKE